MRWSVILWRKFGDSRSKDSEVSTDSELAKASEVGTQSRKGKLPGPVFPLFRFSTGRSLQRKQPSADISVLPLGRQWMDSSSFVNEEWVCVVWVQ